MRHTERRSAVRSDSDDRESGGGSYQCDYVGYAPRLQQSTPSCVGRGVALHILFICTGNICRSPLAERLVISYAARLGISDFSASSAGTHAVVGHPMQPEAAAVLEELGGDATGFAARQLSPRIAAAADLVLTMTRAHRDATLELAPRQLHRTFTLGGAARLVSEFNARQVADLAALRPQLGEDRQLDIPDPIGQSTEMHETVGRQIANLLPPILELCRRD
ncbi:arsenate reductase/protein-tyrosine-phosphatase family protein [Mycolicibacterium elephantis]